MKQFDRSIRYLSGRFEPRRAMHHSKITRHPLYHRFHEKLEEKEKRVIDGRCLLNKREIHGHEWFIPLPLGGRVERWMEQRVGRFTQHRLA